MSVRTFHYYHPDTGALHSRIFKCSGPYAEKDAAANAPAGHHVLEAVIAHPWRMRVDVATGQVIPLEDRSH